MKKLLTLAIAMLMAMSLAACDKDNATNTDQQKTTQNSSLTDVPKDTIAEAEGKSVEDSSKETQSTQGEDETKQIDQGDVWEIREKYEGNYKYTNENGQDVYVSISFSGNDGLSFNDNREWGNAEGDCIPWSEIEDDDSATYTNDSGCLFTFTWSDDGESLQYSIYENGVKETTRDVTATKVRL